MCLKFRQEHYRLNVNCSVKIATNMNIVFLRQSGNIRIQSICTCHVQFYVDRQEN